MALKDSALNIVIKAKDLTGRTLRRFNRSLDQTDKSAKKAGDQIKRMARSVGALIAATVGIGAITAAFKSMLKTGDDFEKLDVVTWSWQKVMGGEGAHGMIVLSPRAIERLESYTPAWPLPKIFRMTSGGKLIKGIFSGATINTVSMLCIEDAVDGLRWAESIGGLPALIERSEANLQAIADWVAKTDWIEFLAEDPATISNTSICLKITADWYQALPAEEQAAKAKQLVSMLDKEDVGYDFGSYRDAPDGLRIWGGATVDTADIEALLPWLDWAFAEIQG